MLLDVVGCTQDSNLSTNLKLCAGLFMFPRRSFVHSLPSLYFNDLHVRYTPAMTPIALTIRITSPAISPPLRLDALLDLVLAISPAGAVVLEYSARNTCWRRRRECDSCCGDCQVGKTAREYDREP
jgi:hypothetical protein